MTDEIIKGHVFRFAVENEAYAFIEGLSLASHLDYHDAEWSDGDDCWVVRVETSNWLGYEGSEPGEDGYLVHPIYTGNYR